MRWIGAKGLGTAAVRIGNKAALATALRASIDALEDPEPNVRAAAAQALARFDAPEAKAALAAYGRQPSVAIAESTFERDHDGWVLCGDGISLTHHAQGGRPGGYLAVAQETL